MRIQCSRFLPWGRFLYTTAAFNDHLVGFLPVFFSAGGFLNQNFTLMKGGSVHIDLGPIKADEYSSATYDAVIRGPNGELYAFGFNKGVYEGWYYDYRY